MPLEDFADAEKYLAYTSSLKLLIAKLKKKINFHHPRQSD